MSDTPTSVSLSKTPAARPAPITTTELRSAVAMQQTHMHAAHVRATTRVKLCGDDGGRISSDFSTPDRGRCYVKLGEKAATHRARGGPLEFLMRPFAGRSALRSEIENCSGNAARNS